MTTVGRALATGWAIGSQEPHYHSASGWRFSSECVCDGFLPRKHVSEVALRGFCLLSTIHDDPSTDPPHCEGVELDLRNSIEKDPLW